MMPIALVPTRMPASATTIGRLIATSDPNATASTMMATIETDLLAAGLGVALRVAEAAVVLHLDAGVASRLGRGVGGLELFGSRPPACR